MQLNLKTDIKFRCFGYFKAPDENWIHVRRAERSYEIFYVTKGTLYVGDDENKYEVHENEYLITEPCKNQHGWKNSYCEFYYFHFYANSADGESYPNKGRYEDLETIEKYYQLLTYRCSKNCVNDHLIAALFLELTQDTDSDIRYKKHDICNDVLNYIKYAQTFQLNILAISKTFNYNEKYISQKISKETGLGLKKHIKSELMQRACYELEHTNHSMEEISYNLGYQDSHSFSHVFKNYMGMSPREYKKSKFKLIEYNSKPS